MRERINKDKALESINSIFVFLLIARKLTNANKNNMAKRYNERIFD